MPGLRAVLSLLRRAGSEMGLASMVGSRSHADRLDRDEVTDKSDTLGARSDESICLCFFLQQITMGFLVNLL